MPEINEGVAADAYRSAEVWAPKTASQTDRYGMGWANNIAGHQYL